MLTQTPNPLATIESKKSIFHFSFFILRFVRSSPLARQLTGAIIGALIAVVAYEGFTFASPYVAGLFRRSDAEVQEQITEEVKEDRLDRIGALAAEKLEKYRAAAPENPDEE